MLLVYFRSLWCLRCECYLRNKNEKRLGDKFDMSMTLGKLLGNNASRLGDKFDRSMTLGKLLGNNAPLFIFISILIMIKWSAYFNYPKFVIFISKHVPGLRWPLSAIVHICFGMQVTQKTDDRIDSRNSDSRNGDSWNKPVRTGWMGRRTVGRRGLLQLGREGLAYCQLKFIGEIMPCSCPLT